MSAAVAIEQLTELSTCRLARHRRACYTRAIGVCASVPSFRYRVFGKMYYDGTMSFVRLLEHSVQLIQDYSTIRRPTFITIPVRTAWYGYTRILYEF